MFRRIVTEDWHTTATVVAFILTASVFITFLVRALRMKRSRAEELARFPLQDDPPAPASHSDRP